MDVFLCLAILLVLGQSSNTTYTRDQSGLFVSTDQKNYRSCHPLQLESQKDQIHIKAQYSQIIFEVTFKLVQLNSYVLITLCHIQSKFFKRPSHNEAEVQLSPAKLLSFFCCSEQFCLIINRNLHLVQNRFMFSGQVTTLLLYHQFIPSFVTKFTLIQ